MNGMEPIWPQNLPPEADKKTVRRRVREAWAACPPEERTAVSARMMEALERDAEFVQARTVLLYWAMPSEVDTCPLIRRWADRKRILLPVMQGNDLLLKPYAGENDLVCHPWGVWEPASGKSVSIREVDLVVTPGAAFDTEGGRLGYGKGFYDRLLTKPEAAACRTLGVCFEFQWYERLPRENHDVAVDRVMVGSLRGVYLHNPQRKD